MVCKLAIIGFGSLGQYLLNAITETYSNQYEIIFIWNRNKEKLNSLPEKWRATHEDLELEIKEKGRNVDLFVEVAHPDIIAQYGSLCLQYGNLFVGSPTAFANQQVETSLRKIVEQSDSRHVIYVPSGALWGADDIAKMGLADTIKGLTITMAKHPSSLKLGNPLQQKIQHYLDEENDQEECIIYEGPVRDLCPLAPNNVNTMACAALAARNLGFDKTKARLVANKKLEAHVIDIEVEGVGGFTVKTRRYNPAKVGAVTGNATYQSFLSSLLKAHGREKGIHFV